MKTWDSSGAEEAEAAGEELASPHTGPGWLWMLLTSFLHNVGGPGVVGEWPVGPAAIRLPAGRCLRSLVACSPPGLTGEGSPSLPHLGPCRD